MTVDLPEDDAYLVHRMIYYCYFGSYDDSPPPSDLCGIRYKYDSPLHFSVEMYAMLEKFGMDGMKKAAEEKIKGAISRPTTDTELIVKHESMLQVIPIIYTLIPWTDRVLHDLICQYVAEHWNNFKDLDKLKDVIAGHPEFMLEVFDRKPPPPPYTKPCRRCARTKQWKADHVTCSCGWGERF